MSVLLGFLGSSAMLHLVSALLHTLWQGLIIAGLLFVALRLLPARHARVRYALTVAALALTVLAGLVTWAALDLPTGRDIISSRDVGRPYRPDPSRLVNTKEAPAPRAPSQRAIAPRSVPWRSWLGLAWMAGAAVMLVRTAFLVQGAGRLRAQCRPLEDRSVQAMVDRLAAGMRVPGRFAVFVGEHVSAPAVMGVIWPALLLPASLLSSLPPHQLRMLIAHELTHIRRYDYLVNLAQLLIEAVLFFNPAVWWISRQIREEREACCDLAVVEATGQSHEYACALVEYVTLANGGGEVASAAPALAGEGRGSLLSRVRRIVRPHSCPAARVSWSGVAGVLVLATVISLALRHGASTAVEAAAKWLSPKERIDRLSKIARTHGPEEGGDEYEKLAKVRVTGTIRPPDGKPVPSQWRYVNVSVRRHHAHIGHSLTVRGSQFAGKVTPGTMNLCADAPGYAPVFLGPYGRKPGEELADIVVELRPGFAAQLRLLDEQDHPVAEAEIEGYFTNDQVSGRQRKYATDTDGGTVVPHATPDADFKLSFRVPGYQCGTQTLRLTSDKTHVVRLSRARPATGRVVSAVTGRPIANAKLWLAGSKGSSMDDPRQEWTRKRGVFWQTDQDGRFAIDSLHEGSTYGFYVEAPGHGPRLLHSVKPGDEELELALGPPIEIRGTIIGRLDQLKRRKGKPQFTYSNPIKFPQMSYHSGLRADVAIDGDVGRFHITDLLPGEVSLSLPGKTIRLDLTESLTDYVVDLRSPEEGGPVEDQGQTRRVIVRVRPPDGSPTPTGVLRVDYVAPDRRAYKPFWLPLEDGQVAIDVPLPEGKPGKFRYGPIRSNGYWLPDKSEIPIPPADDAMVIEARAFPAGAIYGQVIDADGRRASSFNLSLLKVEKPETPDGKWPRNHDVSEGNRPDGRFVLGAIPLGGVYRVTASDARINHYEMAMSAPLTIDAANPVREVTLQLPRGIDLPVRVVNAEGAPVAGASVSLHYSTPYSHGFGFASRSSDRDGRCAFRGVNPELPGEYQVRVDPWGPYQGAQTPVELDGSLQVIEVQEGLTLKGTIIDDLTGKPLPDQLVKLGPHYGSKAAYRGDITGRTDHRGRFALKGLEAARYYVRVGDTRPAGTRVHVDENGRKWYRNSTRLLDLSAIDLDKEHAIRVMKRDDPRLNP